MLRLHLPTNAITRKLVDNTFYDYDVKKTIIKNKIHITLLKWREIKPILLKKAVKAGYPFASVELKQLEKRGDSLLATLDFNLRQQRTLDSIIIKGYSRFPKSYVRHFAQIKKGQVFSQEKLSQKAARLSLLPFVENTRAPEALFQNNQTTLYLYLKKRNANTFEGILGFNTDPNTRKLNFNGYLDLNLHNNLNFGEQLQLHYKADGRNQENLTLNLKTPFLFKSAVGAEASLQIFKRDSSFAITTQQLALNYSVSNKLQLTGGIQNTSSSVLEASTNNPLISNYNTFKTTWGLTYEIPTTNPIWYSHTFLLKAQYGFGNRLLTSEKQKQQNLEISANYIPRITNKTYGRIHAKLNSLQSPSYFINELYRFGGIQSLRGFQENSIDASLYSAINMEYHIYLDSQTMFFPLADAAFFTNKATARDGFLYSLGLGLRLRTNSGILSLIFANGKETGTPFRFSNSQIHINLAANF